MVERDLRDEVARFGNGARINIKRTSDGVRWTVKSRGQADLDPLTKKVEARLEGVAARLSKTKHLRAA